MDKADHIVQRFAIDGDPRMALLDHTFNHLGERCLDMERNDVDAWHHDVCSRPIVNFENISDQDALLRAERMGAVGVGLLDHFVDCFSQALTFARTPDEP